MNNQPLVSIIIPTYKRPDTLDRAIKSVLNQTYQNIEVIVVDDNNPDTEGRALTIEKMKEFENNSMVIYIKHEKNKNGSAARNTGARASKGEYIGFLDDDDEFLPKKIESQVLKLQSLPEEWGMCYNRYYTQKPGQGLVLVKEQREGDLYIEALKQNLCMNAGSNLLIRRAAFDKINGFDESFRRNQDHEFLVRLLKEYKMAYVEEPGLIYKIHPGNPNNNYDEVISHYLLKFRSQIDEMPAKDREELMLKVKKLRFWNYIRPEKKYKKAFKMVLTNEIHFLDAISLIFNKLFGFISHRLKA